MNIFVTFGYIDPSVMTYAISAKLRKKLTKNSVSTRTKTKKLSRTKLRLRKRNNEYSARF